MWLNSAESCVRSVSKAAHPVVIHHPYSLHEGVAHSWTDKIEAAALQVFAHGGGFLSFCRQVLAPAPGVLDRPAAGKLPDVAIETTELFLDLEESPRVAHRRFDLEAVTHNPWIIHETLDSLRFVAGDFSRIKAAEGLAVSFALGQDRGPAQSSLCAFQDEKLKKNLVIVLGNAPLGIVVRDHRRRGGPGAASFVGHV